MVRVFEVAINVSVFLGALAALVIAGAALGLVVVAVNALRKASGDPIELGAVEPPGDEDTGCLCGRPCMCGWEDEAA